MIIEYGDDEDGYYELSSHETKSGRPAEIHYCREITWDEDGEEILEDKIIF